MTIYRKFFGNPSVALGAFELNLEPLSFSVTLAPATLVAGRALNAEPLSFNVTLFDAALAHGFFINAEPLTFNVSLADLTLLADRLLALDALGYTVTLAPATLSTPNISFNAEALAFVVTLMPTRVLLDLDDFPPSTPGEPVGGGLLDMRNML